MHPESRAFSWYFEVQVGKIVPMSQSTSKVEHPYVRRIRGVCGGEPTISGTRFTVRAVVEYAYHQGMSPEEIVREWEHLTLAQVHDALSYYHDHKDLIDRLIRENRTLIPRKRIRA